MVSSTTAMQRTAARLRAGRVLFLAALAVCTPALAAAQTPQCGGFPLAYGTTIGSAGPTASAQQPRSVVALAAVTTTSDTHALAWMIWDERGLAWLALGKRSPADLLQRWSFPNPPDFEHAPVQFSPFSATLPAKYQLTYCSAALASST